MFIRSSFYFSFLLISLVFSSCGKNESSSGTVGAASGAIVGSSLAGKKSKGTGALLGALVGNYIGRKIGREADKEEELDRNVEERRRAHLQREITQVKAENRRLKQSPKKWCMHCSNYVALTGAQRCPDCGTRLIKEKYCNHCLVAFSPEAAYKYCPYCIDRVYLSYR